MNLLGSGVGALLTTLVVGAIPIAVAEEYTVRKMATVIEEPLGSFLYGLVGLVLVGLVALVIVLTVVGTLLPIPLLLVAYPVWAIGASIAFLAVGDRPVGREDCWTKPLVAGAAITAA